MKPIVTFGEIMGRICPENFQKFRQSMPGKLDMTFAGAEANVAASVALLGGKARFVTALPENDITDACISVLKGINIDTSHIKQVKNGRFGLYFIERGANQRPSRVIYDRDYSSISLTPGDSYDWNEIFKNAGWFHTTGITPALSKVSAEATILALKNAKDKEIPVSCDLNFRKKLWQWEEGSEPKELAERTMRRLLPYVDVLIANEEDAQDVLGISAGRSDIESGYLDIEKYSEVAKKIANQFTNIKKVAITLRASLSATHNNWGAMLYDVDSDSIHLAPLDKNGKYKPYEIKAIVDRVGGGDSFGAALIFALNTPELLLPENAIAFAVAASCLAHSINGDFNYSSRKDVEALMAGSGSGRVVR